jgi:hypothetical protein
VPWEESGAVLPPHDVSSLSAALHAACPPGSHTRTKTPQRMLVKARMAALDPATVDDLEYALEERLDTGHIIGLSLILDVLDLHGGDA